MRDTIPLVSICCISYNHEKFILKAFDGFLNQKINFETDIVAYDDFSLDGTRDILKEIEAKGDTSIQLLFPSENKYSKGEKILPKTFEKAKGKYIAICEGDDYWTDSHKLQKQIAFLEAHPECSFCFHKSTKLVVKDDAFTVDYPKGIKKEILTPSDFFKIPTIPTASVVFRNDREVNFLNHSHGDFQLYCQLLSRGNAGFIDETMAVYRVHSQGVSNKYGTKTYLQNRIKEMRIEKSLPAYSAAVRKEIKKILAEHITHYLLKFRGTISFSEKINYFNFLALSATFYSFPLRKKMSIIRSILS